MDGEGDGGRLHVVVGLEGMAFVCALRTEGPNEPSYRATCQVEERRGANRTTAADQVAKFAKRPTARRWAGARMASDCEGGAWCREPHVPVPCRELQGVICEASGSANGTVCTILSLLYRLCALAIAHALCVLCVML